LVLTLGDVLFATGKANLISGASVNLDKLIAFPTLSRTHRHHRVYDSVNGEAYNRDLSDAAPNPARSGLPESRHRGSVHPAG
jgi:hypothetical protein